MLEFPVNSGTNKTERKQNNKTCKHQITMKAIITTISMLAVATTLSIAQDKPSGPPSGGAGGSGGAGQGKRPNPEEIFKQLDKNNDGVLSFDEFKASKRAQQDPTKAEAIFKQLDKNNDGVLSLEEFKSHRPQNGSGQGGNGGQGKGGAGGAGGSGGKGGHGQGA